MRKKAGNKNSNHTLLFTMVLVLLSLISCHDAINECLSGTGSTTTKRMSLYSFGNVKIKDNINLTLVRGNIRELEITAGENIIPMLGVNIINNTLNLSNESTCLMLKDPWKGIEVVLTVPDLDTIFIQSHSKVGSRFPFQMNNLVVAISECPAQIDLEIDCQDFLLQNFSGTADVKIKGHTDRMSCYHAGFGVLDLTGLHSDYMNINMHSTNNSYIRAGEKYFFAVLSDIGNVYYNNDPDRIDLTTESSGRLIRVY